MSNTTRTKQHLLERDERILAHARAGCTVTEIMDLEGLNTNNPQVIHRLLRANGVAVSKRRTNRLPIGLTKETDSWRHRIGTRLSVLKDRLPQIELSRLVGLTNAEINAATGAPTTHDWTISQLYRLSLALNIPFETLVTEAFVEPNYGYKK